MDTHNRDNKQQERFMAKACFLDSLNKMHASPTVTWNTLQ